MSHWVLLGALGLGGYTLYKTQQNINSKNPVDAVTGNGDAPVTDMLTTATQAQDVNIISDPLQTIKQRHQWKSELHPHSGKYKRSKVSKLETQQTPITGLINNGGNQQLA